MRSWASSRRLRSLGIGCFSTVDAKHIFMGFRFVPAQTVTPELRLRGETETPLQDNGVFIVHPEWDNGRPRRSAAIVRKSDAQSNHLWHPFQTRECACHAFKLSLRSRPSETSGMHARPEVSFEVSSFLLLSAQIPSLGTKLASLQPRIQPRATS